MRVRAVQCTALAIALALGAACDVRDVELEDAVGTFVLKRVAGKKVGDRERDRDRDRVDEEDGLSTADHLGDIDHRRDRHDKDKDKDDKPRPRLLEKTAEFVILVVHETVRLRPDGTGTITSVVDLFLIETGKFAGRRIITRDVRFVLDDGKILIADLCDPEELECVLPRNLVMWPEPTWSPKVLYQAFSPGGPALLYERVSRVADVDVDVD